MKKYKVDYQSGEGANRKPVDYMMVLEPVCESDDWETAHIYAEVELEEEDFDEEGAETNEADERHYKQLVEEVTALASNLGISRDQLIFYRD